MRLPKKPANVVWAVIFWVLAAGWIAVLFYFSGQTAGDSSNLSSRLSDAILRRLTFLSVSPSTFEYVLRKLAHFGIFAVEGFLLRAALYNTRPARGINTFIALVIGAVLAVTNELHELTAPGRSCSVTDMAIDFSGATLGILVSSLLCWIAESIYIRKKYARLAHRMRSARTEE